MFQEIEFSELASSEDNIKLSFITTKGLLVIVNDRNIVSIQSLIYKQLKVLLLQQQFINTFQHAFPTIKQINQIKSFDDSTIIMLVSNESICLILISWEKSKDMNENNQESLIIKKIKFIDMKRQLQLDIQPQKKTNLQIIEVIQNMAYLSFVIQNQQFYVIKLKISNNQLGLTIQQFEKCKLNFFPDQQQNRIMIYLLKNNGYQMKKYQNFIYIFTIQAQKNQSNTLLIYDLTKKIGTTLQIFANIELQRSEDMRLLYDVVFIYSAQQLSQTVILFYNESMSIIVVEINLKNPTVPLKREKYSSTLMYRMLKVSMTPQLVELKGYQYAFNNLNFIIQGKSRVDFESKLMIIGSPRENINGKIINSVDVPQGFQHFTMNQMNDLFCVCQRKVYKVEFVSKHNLYQKLLGETEELDSIKSMIEELLE